MRERYWAGIWTGCSVAVNFPENNPFQEGLSSFVANLPTRWRIRVVSQRRDVRLSRFRQILLAARRTGAYREALESAGLTSPRSVTKLRSIEDALQKLPCQTQEQFRGAPEAFDNPSAPPPLLQRLRCPVPDVRAAVLTGNFRETESVRVFDPDHLPEIRRFDPGLIAAPSEILLQWAGAEAAGVTIPSAHRAIVAFTGFEHGALPESTRDLLWETFEVPAFEQWRGADGSVLAWECEAHEGLHVVEQNLVIEQSSNQRLILTSLTDRRRPVLRLVAGFTGTLLDEPCGCGRPGPRLCGVAEAPLELSASAVAAASR